MKTLKKEFDFATWLKRNGISDQDLTYYEEQIQKILSYRDKDEWTDAFIIIAKILPNHDKTISNFNTYFNVAWSNKNKDIIRDAIGKNRKEKKYFETRPAINDPRSDKTFTDKYPSVENPVHQEIILLFRRGVRQTNICKITGMAKASVSSILNKFYRRCYDVHRRSGSRD